MGSKELPLYLEPPPNGGRSRSLHDPPEEETKRRSRGGRRRSRGGARARQERQQEQEQQLSGASVGSDYRITAHRQTGAVLWYDEGKRFGFIQPDDGSNDVFVHQEQVLSAGLLSLSKKQRVEYDVGVPLDGETRKRTKVVAVNLRTLPEQPSALQMAERSRTMPVTLLTRPDVPEESTRAPLYARGAPIEEEPPLDFTHIPQDYGLNGGGLHDVVPSERKKSNGKHKKKKDRQGGRGVHAANGFSAQSSGYQNFLDDDTDDYGGYSSNAFGATAAMLGGSSAASMLGQSVQAAQQTAPNPYAPAFEPNAGAPAFVPLSFPPASSAAASATPSLFADETTLGRTNPQPQLAESTGAPVALSGQPVYVRTATAKDIEACASFMYKAFRQAADRANAYSDTARTPERTAQIIQDAVESDGVHAVVAVAPHAGSGGGGELCLGFNCLHEANAPLFGVGPLGVNPDYQSQSIGRQLVAAALQRAATVMQGLHGTTTTIGDGDDGGGGGNSSPRQDQAAAAGVATDASAGAAVDGLPAAVEPSAEQAPQQAGDGTDGSHGGPTMAGQPPLHSEAPSADDSKAAKPAATVRLTVDAYNSVAMALYVKSGFVVSETLTVLHSPPLDLSKAAAALGPLDDGWVFDEMEDSDLDACDVLSTRYAGCSRAGEIFAALQRPREQGGVYVVRGADGNIEGYTTGLNFWGHTVASSTEAAVALFKGVRQQDATADLRVIMPYRTQPRLGSWCLDHGWRVVKQLLLMTHGPEMVPDPAGVFVPTADG